MATPACASRSRLSLLRLRARVSTPRVASATIAAGDACAARVVACSARLEISEHILVVVSSIFLDAKRFNSTLSARASPDLTTHATPGAGGAECRRAGRRSRPASRQLLGAFAALTCASLALFYPPGRVHIVRAVAKACGNVLSAGVRPSRRRGRAYALSTRPGYTEPFAFPLARVFANARYGRATPRPFAETTVTDAGRVMAIGTRAPPSSPSAARTRRDLLGRERTSSPDAGCASTPRLRRIQADAAGSSRTVEGDLGVRGARAAERMDADGGGASTRAFSARRWDVREPPRIRLFGRRRRRRGARREKHAASRPVWVPFARTRTPAREPLGARGGRGASASDPPGGSIGRVAGTTRPNGLIRENAIGLITAAIPEPSDARRIAAYHRAFGICCHWVSPR